MTSSNGKPPGSRYEVGYRKPPMHSRFRKGQTGNPGGRPRGMTAGRAIEMALKEAYRLVNVREGENVYRVPAIQAVMRSQVTLAAKGNGPAQRTLIETIRAIERELAARVTTKECAGPETPGMSDLEIARRIAFLLERGRRALEQQKAPAASAGNAPTSRSDEK